MVWWLGLSTFTAVVPDLIPGWETKITQAVQYRQKKKKERKKTHKNKQTKNNNSGKEYFLNVYMCITESLCCTAEIDTTL